uniref:Uncharacterized protein n=1 Tax=Neospora caninum (strain Liverpool) TaxID=572307 RepID=A0A0F7UPF8_NEOCL|nr:TPA: hypothetical protein BN1204_065710 [Neospora caninum Liverpool]
MAQLSGADARGGSEGCPALRPASHASLEFLPGADPTFSPSLHLSCDVQDFPPHPPSFSICAVHASSPRQTAESSEPTGADAFVSRALTWGVAVSTPGHAPRVRAPICESWLRDAAERSFKGERDSEDSPGQRGNPEARGSANGGLHGAGQATSVTLDAVAAPGGSLSGHEKRGAIWDGGAVAAASDGGAEPHSESASEQGRQTSTRRALVPGSGKSCVRQSSTRRFHSRRSKGEEETRSERPLAESSGPASEAGDSFIKTETAATTVAMATERGEGDLKRTRSETPRSGEAYQSRYVSGESSLTTRVGGASTVPGSGPSESRDVSGGSAWRSLSRWSKWNRKAAPSQADEDAAGNPEAEVQDHGDPEESFLARMRRQARPDSCWIAPKPIPEIPGLVTGPVYTVAAGAQVLTAVPKPTEAAATDPPGTSLSLFSTLEGVSAHDALNDGFPRTECLSSSHGMEQRTASAPDLRAFSSKPTVIARVGNTGWVRRITRRSFKGQRAEVQGRKMPSVPALLRSSNWIDSDEDDDDYELQEAEREEEARKRREQAGAIRRPPHYTFSTAYTTKQRGRKLRGPLETPKKLREVQGRQIYPLRSQAFGISTPSASAFFRKRPVSPNAMKSESWQSIRAISLIGAAATDTSSPDATSADEFEQVTCAEEEHGECKSSTYASCGGDGSSVTDKATPAAQKAQTPAAVPSQEKGPDGGPQTGEDAASPFLGQDSSCDGAECAGRGREPPSFSSSVKGDRVELSAQKKWITRPKVYTEEEEKQRAARRKRREERRACRGRVPAVSETFPVAKALLDSLLRRHDRLCLQQGRLALLDETTLRELMFWKVVRRRQAHGCAAAPDCEGFKMHFLEAVEAQLMRENDQDALPPEAAQARTQEFVGLLKMAAGVKAWRWEAYVEEEVERCLRAAEKKRRTELWGVNGSAAGNASVLTPEEKRECEDACRERLRQAQEEHSASLSSWFDPDETPQARSRAANERDGSSKVTGSFSSFLSDAHLGQTPEGHRNLLVDAGRALGHLFWGPLASPSHAFPLDPAGTSTVETSSGIPESPSVISSSSASHSTGYPLDDRGDPAFSHAGLGLSAESAFAAFPAARNRAGSSPVCRYSHSAAARAALKKAQKHERREVRKLMRMCDSIFGDGWLQADVAGQRSAENAPSSAARRGPPRQLQEGPTEAEQEAETQRESAKDPSGPGRATGGRASPVESAEDSDDSLAFRRLHEKWVYEDSEDGKDVNRGLKEVVQKLFREQRRMLRKQSERVRGQAARDADSGPPARDSRRLSSESRAAKSDGEDAGETPSGPTQHDKWMRKQELDRIDREERNRAGLLYKVVSPLQPLVLLQDSNFWFDLKRLAEEWKLSQRKTLYQLFKKTVQRWVQSAQKHAERTRRKENRIVAAAILGDADLPFPKPTLRLAPRFFFAGRPAAEIVVILSSLFVRRQAIFNCERLKNLMSCKSVIYYVIDANSVVADGQSPDMRLLRRWKRQRIVRNAPHTHHRGILVPQVLVDGHSIGSYGDVQQLEDDGVLTAVFARCRCPTCLQPRHVEDQRCRWCKLQFRELLSVRRQGEGQLKEMYRGHPTRAIPILSSCFDRATSWVLYPHFCSLCGAERRPDQPWCPQCHMTIRDVALAKSLGVGIYREDRCHKCGKPAGDVLDCLERLPPQADPKFSRPPMNSYFTSKASPLCRHCGELLTYFLPIEEKIAEERREFGKASMHRRRKKISEIPADAETVDKPKEDAVSKQEEQVSNAASGSVGSQSVAGIAS